MAQNNSPQLTIIIPTLNRCETLYWAIKTVVEQEYDNLKIIVSDNCSDDNTYNVIHQFSDPRLTYRKTPSRFTMLEHFEYALNYVESGYVSFIGDDDGFLPGALQKIAPLLQKHKPLAVGWRFGNYNWPGLPGYFMIPMGNYYRKVDAKKEIAAILKKDFYQAIQFPSLYGGFISVEFVQQLKARFNGVFFHSRIPDFFSGAFIASTVQEYYRLEFPVTINATSRHSAGFATVNTSVDQKPFDGIRLDAGNVPFHPSLYFMRCNVVPIADALLQVNRIVPSFPKVSIKKVIDEVLLELKVEPDQNKFAEIKQGLLEIGKKNGLEQYVEDSLNKLVPAPALHVVKRKFSPVSISLYVDAEKAGITNVYEAARFTNKVISKQYYELKYPFQKKICGLMQYLRYLQLKMTSAVGKYF